jgi:hypothetical protein
MPNKKLSIKKKLVKKVDVRSLQFWKTSVFTNTKNNEPVNRSSIFRSKNAGFAKLH